jgi:serine/threonine protein kinase
VEHLRAVSARFEPIPESTQVHVDRLVGARVGDYTILTRAAEGRFGTLYRGTHTASSKPVTVEVLRTELVGNDEEARAANAIKCAAIADVVAFGQVPDGRRFRVMEQLEGESLDAELQRRGKLAPNEALSVLIDVAGVLQAAHAWAITHGGLGTTNVLRVGGKVKVIDFGVVHGAALEVDLQALGALGFALLTGRELDGGAPPPLGSGVPELIDRLLRELLEKRIADATTAQRELQELLQGSSGLKVNAASPVASAKPRTSRALPALAVVLLLALAAGGAWVALQGDEPAVDEGEALSDEELAAEPDDAPEPQAAVTPQQPEQPGGQPTPPRPSTGSRKPKPVPTAAALMATISKLEARFHKQGVRPGDDVDQALFVLNQQRLRLTGNPSEADRRDVARQLAGWKRSYLR